MWAFRVKWSRLYTDTFIHMYVRSYTFFLSRNSCSNNKIKWTISRWQTIHKDITTTVSSSVQPCTTLDHAETQSKSIFGAMCLFLSQFIQADLLIAVWLAFALYIFYSIFNIKFFRRRHDREVFFSLFFSPLCVRMFHSHWCWKML